MLNKITDRVQNYSHKTVPLPLLLYIISNDVLVFGVEHNEQDRNYEVDTDNTKVPRSSLEGLLILSLYYKFATSCFFSKVSDRMNRME